MLPLTQRIDVLVYVAMSEEFSSLIAELGNGFKAEEVSGLALTMYFGVMQSTDGRRDYHVAVIPAGKMGNTRSANVTSAILERFKPSSVVVLGIAGSVSDDLHPGDIFIPESVDEYLANSATVRDGDTWTFRTSGNHFQTSALLLNRFQAFCSVNADSYEKWADYIAELASTLITSEIRTAVKLIGMEIRDKFRPYVGDDRKLASGPAVGKGKAFVDWLRQVDRKVAAIEMESAGVYDAALIRDPPPRAIAIRAISDYADERKEKFERATHGVFRNLAMKNAVSFLRCAIIEGIFSESTAVQSGASSSSNDESVGENSFPQELSEPTSDADFVGRETQLSELDERLKVFRLVTVVGPGGMGKTRLALEYIKRRRRKERQGLKFIFASFELLTNNSESAVLEWLLACVQTAQDGGSDTRTSLVERLGSSPTLLVLDNCETARGGIAPLARFLLRECANLTIFATSQHQLGLQGLEAVYELPPLSVPGEEFETTNNLEKFDSYRLFVARAQMADASWSPEVNSTASFRRLLQLTDGIPLAIEIVAAWAPLMSLTKICEELIQTPLGSVTEVDTFNSVASERHRSMLRCFEWSFGHFESASPNDAEGFKRLWVFAGRFTEDAVEKVCEIESPRKLLARLVKMSLVHLSPRTDPRRYYLLRFTRAFARGKGRIEGLWKDLINRHVNHYSNLANNLIVAHEGSAIPRRSFEHDWPDLLVAADSAFRTGNFHSVIPISRALGPYLQQRGLWSERLRLNRTTVDAAKRLGSRTVLERASIDLGIVLEAQGCWPEAAFQYKLSLRSADNHKNPNPVHQALALQRLGAVLIRMGDIAGADRAGKRLSRVTRLLDQPKSKARSLDEEGKIFERRGDLDSAESKYSEALAIRKDIADREGVARSRNNLGILFTRRALWEIAENELRSSLEYWVAEKSVLEEGIVLHLLADLFRRQQRYSEAHDYCGRSLKCRKDDPKGRAVTLSLLAKIFRMQNDFEKAVIASQQSRELCRSLGDAEGESIALDDIGASYAAQRRWDAALEAFDESLRLKESKTRRDIVGLGITFDRIAQIYAQRENWTQAQTAYTKSLKFSQEAGQTVSAAITMINMAMMQAAQGRKKAALEILAEAIASLEAEQSWQSVLQEARNIRSTLESRMRDSIPWVQWRDAAFKPQQLFIRKIYENLRKAAYRDPSLWKNVASSYETLVEQFTESGQQLEAALARTELGGAYRHLSDFRRSEDTLRSALAIFEEISSPLGQATCWHKLGDLFAEQNQSQIAEEAYKKSIELKQERGIRDGEAITQDALALLLIRNGRLAEAEQAASRAWDLFSKDGTIWQKWHTLIRMLWIKVEQNNHSVAQAIIAQLTEAVVGNRELETAVNKVRVMADVGNWNGVKNSLERMGFEGTAP